MSTFRLEMLPAADGDCLVLTWGDNGPLRHIVVDGGRASAYPHLRDRLARIATAGETLDLLVLTHIDADHIEGTLAFLRDPTRPIAPGQVWYNGRREATSAGTRSMAQGDAYSNALAALGWPLNTAFPDRIARIESAQQPIDLAGLKITMLSPDAAHLAALGTKWEQWHRQGDRRRGAGPKPKRPPIPDPLVVEDLIAPGPMDTEAPNGSSIAFVAEWMGRRVLLAGDAHPDLLARSLEPLAAQEGGRYRVNLLKASHHGSTKNTSGRLVELLDCRRLAISTNGAIHGHPDPQSIARFLHFAPAGAKHVHFNYITDRTRPWIEPGVQDRYNYCAYAPTAQPGAIAIDLLADG